MRTTLWTVMACWLLLPLWAQTWTDQTFTWDPSYPRRVDGTYAQYAVKLAGDVPVIIETTNVVPQTTDDTYLYLLDARGDTIAVDNDSGSGRASRIAFWPGTGTRPFIRGDADGNGLVDARDYTRIYRVLFEGASYGGRQDAFDANDDGSVDLSDVIYLASFLSGSGPRPPAPFPAAGWDRTPDSLGGGAYQVRLRSQAAGLRGRCTLRVAANRPPSITPYWSGTAGEGAKLNLWLFAWDPDGAGIVEFTAESLPPGATSSRYGWWLRINWTPTFDQAGVHTLAARAVDGDGIERRQEFPITIRNVNRPPSLVASRGGAVEAVETETVRFDVTAADPDGDVLGTISATMIEGAAEFTFDGRTFEMPTGLRSAGAYRVRFRVEDAGGDSASLDVEIAVADIPTKEISYDGRESNGTLTVFLADGVHPYLEVQVNRDPDGRLADTRTKIDIVMIGTGYKTLAEVSTLFAQSVAEARESILQMEQFKPEDFNFWAIPIMETRSQEGDLGFNPWLVARELIPGGAVDFVLRMPNEPGQTTASPSVRWATIFRGDALRTTAHEFGHIIHSPQTHGGFLGDEYLGPGKFYNGSRIHSTYRRRAEQQTLLRLRSFQYDIEGSCTVRISPPPILDTMTDPGWTRVTLTDGTPAVEWRGVTAGVRSDYREPWFDPQVPLRAYGTMRGDYNQLRVHFAAAVDYSIDVFDIDPALLYPFLIVAPLLPGLGPEYAGLSGQKNITPVRPWFDGARWRGDLWDHLTGPDPNVAGQIVGWYEMRPGNFRPLHYASNQCQMNSAGAAPFCAVCAAAVEDALAVDAGGSSLIRDDHGPAPNVGYSYWPDTTPMLTTSFMSPVGHVNGLVRFYVYANEADSNDPPFSDGLPAVVAESLPAGATFRDGIFEWIPSSGQAGIHRVRFFADNALGRRGWRTAAITVKPTADSR